MQVEVQYTDGVVLAWLVAKCEGVDVRWSKPHEQLLVVGKPYTPYSINWAVAGPIIEHEHIGLWWTGIWHAKCDGCQPRQVQDAHEPLIAAMRCYVASKIGCFVDVPDELI